MKKEQLSRECERMRRENGTTESRAPAAPLFEPEQQYCLSQAAEILGVSYHTARRLAIAENVKRFAVSATGQVLYPGSRPARGQRTRMTYVVSTRDIESIKRKMRGNGNLPI